MAATIAAKALSLTIPPSLLLRAPLQDVLARDLSRIGMKWTPILFPDDPLFVKR